MDKNSLAHTKWNCKYHIVFTPKYRRKAIYGKIKKRYRSKCMSRPYTYVSEHTTKDSSINIYGIFKGKNFINDI